MSLSDLDFETVTAVNEYGFYCIPEHFKTREVSKLLLDNQVNEPRTLQLIRQFSGTGDVVSGGAFVGDFLPALSRGLSTKARLHSFEPSPDSHAAAVMTARMNKLSNLDIHHVAVGSEEGVLPLQIANDNGKVLGGMSKIVEKHEEGKTIEVPVVTLDSMVDAKRKVSVIHLDVEGHEWHAILGAHRIVEKNSPVLVLECTKKWMRKDYEKRLNEAFPDHGYHLVASMERNSFYVPLNKK